MQNGHGQDEGTKEPVGDINVLDLAGADCAKENHSKSNPDQSNQYINGPLQLRVFLALGKTQGQRDRSRQDDQLPAPKGKGGQFIGKKADMAGALHHVIRRGKQTTAPERKNHRVGMQGSQPPIAQPGNSEIEFRPCQLGRNDHAHEHANHTPNHCHDGELTYNGVVVATRLLICKCHIHLFD